MPRTRTRSSSGDAFYFLEGWTCLAALEEHDLSIDKVCGPVVRAQAYKQPTGCVVGNCGWGMIDATAT
jgi:hypothetical protein